MQTTPTVGNSKIGWNWLSCQQLALVTTVVTLLANPSCVLGESRRIILDGAFDDWSQAAAITDQIGDVPAGGANVDFVTLRSANDERNLFFALEFTQPLLLQDLNAITLYLDTDLDSATGLQEGDRGADIIWRFGQRVGTNYTASGPQMIVVGDLNLRPAPTVTSARFEMAIPLDLALFGERIFTKNAVRVLLRGNGAAGDRIPDTDSLIVRFSDDPLPPAAIRPVEKAAPTAIRVVTWNTLDAGVFDLARQERFRGVLQALRPDVLSLQEMSEQSREAARGLIAAWLLYSPTWNVVANGSAKDSVILSRYPVLGWWNASGSVDCTGALLDTTESIGHPTLVIAAHLSCCANDSARNRETGIIAAFIQDARIPGGRFTIPERTPIVLMGDFNLVGKAEQLTTLLEGRFVQGVRQAPDWDGSALAELVAQHNAAPETYTWRATLPGIRFYPGRLDYILYTDSVISPLRGFVFQTDSLPTERLAALNLNADDVFQASDHAPVVADFVLAAPRLKIEKTSAPPQLTIFTAPDRLFQVQHSSDLIQWENLLPPILSLGPSTNVADPQSDRAPRRFYRAVNR
jgi:endonuclease/exonuclease/phosphatase family metal-dependent hydrolase